MVTMNGPFLIALAAIIFIIAIKWMEWYLFKNGAFRFHSTNTWQDDRAVSKKTSRFGMAGKKAKDLLFFGKADLKHPWYERVLFSALVMTNYLVVSVFDFKGNQCYVYLAFSLVVTVGLSLFFEIHANKVFFAVPEHRKRYIRTQIAQCILTLLILTLIIAGLQIHAHNEYADQSGLKASVDWAIEPVYDANWPEFTEGLAPVGSQGKMGYIDKTGNAAIPFRYLEAGNFHEGLAAVRMDWRWGYIDRTGKVIIPFQYDEALQFGDGLAPVKKDGKWMVIDHAGSVRFQTDYKMIYSFQEGVAQVELKDKKQNQVSSTNLIDSEGNLLFKKDYVIIGNYSEGCVFAWDNETGKGYFFDKNENKVIRQGFIDTSGFSGGVASVWIDDEEYAMIDHSGNTVRKLSADEFNNFPLCHEGLITVNNGERFGDSDARYGLEDQYGNTMLPTSFEFVTSPSDGMIGLMVDGQWGFIKNPLPAAARGADPEVWASDRTKIATVEGLTVYAGELERVTFEIKEDNPELTGIPAYKKAFEQIKTEKAFEKYGKNIEPEKIRYQIGDTYYKKLLL